MKTKKITTYLLATACAAVFASCDMDKYPYDRIPVENAVTNLSDCQNLRSGMYRDLRILSSSQDNFLATEMQADCIVPTASHGHTYSPQYLWTMGASEGTVTQVWANNYVAIAQCNLLIGGIPSLEESGALSEADMTTARNILGEAYMVRAMCYFDLATKFCNLYDAATAENEMGVPLVTEYAPSGDNSTYPGRSSLAATYQRITDDIASAKANMTAAGETASIYLTVDALLITDAGQFANMWKNDAGSELICQLYADQQETTTAMGSYFLDEVYESQSMLPAYDILTMYSEGDIRFNAYFTSIPVNISGTTYEGLYSINKYPGNPALNSGSVNEMRNR